MVGLRVVFARTSSPAAPERRGCKRAVMVFVHGGASVWGSQQYDPQRLSEEGRVIVVTLNCRLGALGLLSLPELDA
jgi:para-nitrobenzyl esterase